MPMEAATLGKAPNRLVTHGSGISGRFRVRPFSALLLRFHHLTSLSPFILRPERKRNRGRSAGPSHLGCSKRPRRPAGASRSTDYGLLPSEGFAMKPAPPQLTSRQTSITIAEMTVPRDQVAYQSRVRSLEPGLPAALCRAPCPVSSPFLSSLT